MLRRLWTDESGVALGLAVILVVLVGVMGAGFLVVVRGDLDSLIAANRGQRAFALADAGAQAGVSRLRSDANPDHYDGDAPGNVRWAYVSPDGERPGRVLALDSGSARVTVRYLLPAAGKEGLANKERAHAPEPLPGGLTDYPNGRDYFLVVSEATSGDARRKVEVIVRAVPAGDSRNVEQWGWREAYQ